MAKREKRGKIFSRFPLSDCLEAEEDVFTSGEGASLTREKTLELLRRRTSKAPLLLAGLGHFELVEHDDKGLLRQTPEARLYLLHPEPGLLKGFFLKPPAFRNVFNKIRRTYDLSGCPVPIEDIEAYVIEEGIADGNLSEFLHVFIASAQFSGLGGFILSPKGGVPMSVKRRVPTAYERHEPLPNDSVELPGEAQSLVDDSNVPRKERTPIEDLFKRLVDDAYRAKLRADGEALDKALKANRETLGEITNAYHHAVSVEARRVDARGDPTPLLDGKSTGVTTYGDVHGDVVVKVENFHAGRDQSTAVTADTTGGSSASVRDSRQSSRLSYASLNDRELERFREEIAALAKRAASASDSLDTMLQVVSSLQWWEQHSGDETMPEEAPHQADILKSLGDEVWLNFKAIVQSFTGSIAANWITGLLG